MQFDLKKLLLEQRLILCGGSGGVGKTTSAAALGVLGAQLGRRTLVLTIDPARRLANAMGLASIEHTPTAVPQIPGLWVMMLDAGQTVDELVGRHAPGERTRDALLANPYYQQISSSVAGSREFVAMEKLHELLSDERFDLLIVDTPPAQHALDFLDAPKRLLEMLDGSGLGFLLRSTSVANRLSFGMLGRSQKQLGKLVERLTGHRLMLDLNAFYETFETVIDGFKERAAAMEQVLRSDAAAFVLVLIPEPDATLAARSYLQRLRRESMQLAGLLFNQVQPAFPMELPPDEVLALLRSNGLSQSEAQAALDCQQNWHARALAQREQIASWHADTQVASIAVPRLQGNVHSLSDLLQFSQALQSQ